MMQRDEASPWFDSDLDIVHLGVARAMRELARCLNASADPVQLAHLTVTHARALLDAEAAALYWHDAEATLLVRLAAEGAASFPHAVRPGHGSVGTAFAPDSASLPSETRIQDRDAKNCTTLAWPVLRDGGPVGVIAAVFKTPIMGEERREGERLLAWLAAQIAPGASLLGLHARAERWRRTAELLAGLVSRPCGCSAIGREDLARVEQIERVEEPF